MVKTICMFHKGKHTSRINFACKNCVYAFAQKVLRKERSFLDYTFYMIYGITLYYWVCAADVVFLIGIFNTM